jgi:uncharacterized Tic20 family protein
LNIATAVPYVARMTPVIDGETLNETTQSEGDRTAAALSHALVLLGYLVPFANIIVPLVIYLTKKDASSFVADHAKESLNFQINQLVLTIAFAVLSLVGIGCVLLLAQCVFELIVVIRASMAAKDGQTYRYPLTLRIL